MGFARKRVGKGGKVKYTAAYRDLRGSIRSAGTFTSERAANHARQKAEVELRQGRVGDPARGRQTLRKYVEERWLNRPGFDAASFLEEDAGHAQQVPCRTAAARDTDGS
jgi:hypothetical protein